MSTFDGLVKEFPSIRIDYFRNHPDKPRPSALFLSHVHSDHLLGLESVKMPFVYCSHTTRQLLLRMEKYPHRINFAKGILERRKQTYRHLKSILRPLPLQTPTEIELGPKSAIRVTLFDANHCPGAVMFLLEDGDKAIVYTGDVRAEPWWVNSIVQNPVLLPYSCGIKTLDCVYLDTTFATHDEPYRDFPTKAEGLAELIRKVNQYPTTTIFYFRSWTLGYENVWVTLSDAIKSRIHVDEYQLQLLRSREEPGHGFHEGPALTGFILGNDWHQGCLTTKIESKTRIHSCEPGTPCHAKVKQEKNVVWISPIISRLRDGTEVRELGAGGGWGDLYQNLGFAFEDLAALQQFETFCSDAVEDQISKEVIQKKIEESRKLRGSNLTFGFLEGLLSGDDGENVSLVTFKEALKKAAAQRLESNNEQSVPSSTDRALPQTIHFPYSRHSSYNELCHLVGKFRPKDICPCTVDLDAWTENVSMESLFGDLCSERVFFYDQETRAQAKKLQRLRELDGGKKRKRGQEDSQETASQESADEQEALRAEGAHVDETSMKASGQLLDKLQPDSSSGSMETHKLKKNDAFEKKDRTQQFIIIEDDSDHGSTSLSDFGDLEVARGDPPCHSHRGTDGQTRSRSDEEARRIARREAYKAAKRCLDENDNNEWNWYPLRSVGRRGHDEEEEEL